MIRQPSKKLPEGLSQEAHREPVDYAVALEQWEAYVDLLNYNGWCTHFLNERPNHADGVFIEDNVVFYKGVGLITRPGATERSGEI